MNDTMFTNHCWRKIILVVFLLVLVLGIYLAANFSQKTPSVEEGVQYHSITLSNGETREYGMLLPTPHQISDAPLPLIIVLHGGSKNDILPDKHFPMEIISENERAAILYPIGTHSAAGYKTWKSWNAEVCCKDATTKNVDDLTFLSELIDAFSKQYSVGEVNLIGFSNGGQMALRFACEESHRVNAVATISGNYGAFESCVADAGIRHITVVTDHFLEDEKYPTEYQPISVEVRDQLVPSAYMRTGSQDKATHDAYYIPLGEHNWPPIPLLITKEGKKISLQQLLWEFFTE